MINPVNVGNIKAMLDALSKNEVILYDSGGPASEYQISLPDDLSSYDYIDIFWRYSHSGTTGDDCARFMGSLVNGTCFAFAPGKSGMRYNVQSGIINVSGNTLTMTAANPSGDIEGNYLFFRRVVGYRAGGGGAAPS